MGMGLELRGQNATWVFETDSVRVRYGTGIRVPALLKELREVVVPDVALAGADVSVGSRRTILQMRLRQGACPLLEAAAGQLGEGSDPYRIVLRADQADLAEHYAEDLRTRAALNPAADRPAERFLLPGPRPPRHVKAYDGNGVFDGKTVAFRWMWSGASSAKWRAGDQVFPVSDIVDVEWAAPGVLSGHLRVRLRGDGDDVRRLDPDQDPRALTFGVGYGLTHESLTFAAAVLYAIADHRTVVRARARGGARGVGAGGAATTATTAVPLRLRRGSERGRGDRHDPQAGRAAGRGAALRGRVPAEEGRAAGPALTRPAEGPPCGPPVGIWRPRSVCPSRVGVCPFPQRSLGRCVAPEGSSGGCHASSLVKRGLLTATPRASLAAELVEAARGAVLVAAVAAGVAWVGRGGAWRSSGGGGRRRRRVGWSRRRAAQFPPAGLCQVGVTVLAELSTSPEVIHSGA
nr:hypothetical protein GCM10020241_17070 [Streptoalloteichus tenebrarius]